jgi:hypothetical protein
MATYLKSSNGIITFIKLDALFLQFGRNMVSHFKIAEISKSYTASYIYVLISLLSVYFELH